MKVGSRLFNEEDLKNRHVKDNKTRFYWINCPEISEKGAGFFLRLSNRRAVNFFVLWQHK